MLRGDCFDWTAGEVPLGRYATKWIAERVGLAPRTVVMYEPLLRRHISPGLGSIELVALTPGRCGAWRTDLLASGVGPPTVAKSYRLLRSGVRGGEGATMRRGNFQRMWSRAIKSAGLPNGFHFHDLRHTGNTWAADSGASLRDLMDRMGHSSMRAALIYMHASKGASRAIAAGIDRQLEVVAKKSKDRGQGRASGT